MPLVIRFFKNLEIFKVFPQLINFERIVDLREIDKIVRNQSTKNQLDMGRERYVTGYTQT